MLSSGLPASLNPEPVAAIARSYAGHPSTVQPDDTRAAALCELVAILKRAAKGSGSPNVRDLDSVSLRQANVEFDTWERDWKHLLGETIQHNQMPFTTLRAYRLAINSACLSTLLSASSETSATRVSLHELHALEVSLDAASQTIFALSEQAHWHTWHGKVTRGSSFPPGPLTADDEAIKCISYSVDSSWITHSFAVVFLVLCYCRGAIDDDLGIPLLARDHTAHVYPNLPAASSRLFRLLSLARTLFHQFDTKIQGIHPVSNYRQLIDSVLAAVLMDKDGLEPTVGLVAPSVEQSLEHIMDSIGVFNSPRKSELGSMPY